MTSHLEDACDGTADRQCFEYTDEGDATKPCRRRTETLCGGPAECEDYSFKASSTFTAASDCAASPHRCVAIETNEDGHVVSTEIDWRCDGSEELCSHFEYDERGNLTSKTEGSGCDDSPNRCETHVYVGECRFAAAVHP